MKRPAGHLGRCLVAGLVALLPLGGVVLAVVWLEHNLSASWRQQVGFYVPGLGLLLALLLVYLVGLFVTTVLGRWLWRRVDRRLERMPLLGAAYQSLKEVLGYDSARHKFFEAVVAVPVEGGLEVGFVTGSARGPAGEELAVVFLPGAPNPTNGRLRLLPRASLQVLDVRTADALRMLVSMGKSPLQP